MKRSVRAPVETNPRRIVVPKAKPRQFYGQGVPGMDLSKLGGKLIVVEGADGSGRSSQIARLVQWLEGCGHATVQVGLKRSTLVSEELDHAKAGNVLSRTTFSLFYATDFADQIENIILPALKAGRLVLIPGSLMSATGHHRVDAYASTNLATQTREIPDRQDLAVP